MAALLRLRPSVGPTAMNESIRAFTNSCDVGRRVPRGLCNFMTLVCLAPSARSGRRSQGSPSTRNGASLTIAPQNRIACLDRVPGNGHGAVLGNRDLLTVPV